MGVFVGQIVLGQRWECLWDNNSVRTEMGVFVGQIVLGQRWECL